MTAFVPPSPERLYTRETLFGGFDEADPLSWTRTLDGRAYRSFVASGRRRAPLDVARRQAEHDTSVTADLETALAGCRPVAIMGGHQLVRGDAGYRAVASIARSLAREGLTVLTGGGPGAMEAAHLGARLSALGDAALEEAVSRLAVVAQFPVHRENDLIAVDGTFDDDVVRALHAWQLPAFRVADETSADATTTIGVPTWLYGHEPPSPLATHHAKYFANSIREDGLLAVATYGVVYAPGSAGTLQEIYQDAAQNYYRSVDDLFSPMVFLDLDGVWSSTYAVDTALRRLLKPDDFATMVAFVETPADAVRAVVSRRDAVDRALARG